MERLFCALLLISTFAYTSQSDPLYFEKAEHCAYNNKYYAINTTGIPHLRDMCQECVCCETGRVKCKKVDCGVQEQPPPCGQENRVAYGTRDCCMNCSDECWEFKKSLDCPKCTKEQGYYRHYAQNGSLADVCCGTCGACKFRGHIIPHGATIDDPHIAHACSNCTCNNGDVTCTNRVSCYNNPKIRCVKPVMEYNSTSKECVFGCPMGPSCFRDDVEIFENEVKVVGDKLCWCLVTPTIYWPLAMCGNKGHDANFEEYLENELCVANPINPMLWYDSD